MTTPANDLPDVDVIVPTRDRPDLLRETIDAILRQDYPARVRVIVVFDQSEPDMSLVVSDAARPVLVVSNNRRAGLAGSLADTGLLLGREGRVLRDGDVQGPSVLRARRHR